MTMSSHQRLLHYTKQLASHVNNHRHHEALSLFTSLHSFIALDPFVFPLALKSCSALRLPRLLAAVHAHTVRAGFSSNPFVASALVDAYGKSQSILSARKVFDESHERNVVVWNTMVSLYAHSNDVTNALKLFESMDVAPNASTCNSIITALVNSSDGCFNEAIGFYRRMIDSGVEPNLITVLALLSACVSLNLVKEIHGFSFRYGLFVDCQLSSGLVEAYGKRGGLHYARAVFDRLTYRDVVAWSSMVSAYALHGEAECALDVFRRMDAANVRPDGIMFLAVLKACSHAGLAEEALKYFGMMSEHYGLVAGSDHYGCLVDVLSRSGRLNEAYEVIRAMPMKPTATAWGALLGSCRSYGNVKLAEIAGRMLFEIEPENARNFVILANIYASAGRFQEAESVRKEMKERFLKRAPGSSWVS